MQKKVESLQSVVTKSSVNSVLDMVRQLASRPSALVDPYALVAALEQGLEGYFWDPGFDRNTVRDSGKRKIF